VLDLAGCDRLLLGGSLSLSAQGERRWLLLAARLQRRLSEAGVTSTTVGLGPSRTVAWLAAFAAAHSTSSSWHVVRPEQVAAFLRPVPLGALLTVPDLREMPGAPEMLAALAQGGLMTTGQVARLPATALRRRFGPLGTRLATLAAGQDVRPLRIWVPAPWMGARVRLEPAMDVGRLSEALLPLAMYLAAALSQRQLGASEVALVLHRDDGTSWRATRRLGQPTASAVALADHAWRLLRRLAEHERGGAACAGLHLRVGTLRPLRARQDMLWLSQSERERRARRARLLAPDGPLATRLHGRAALLRAQIRSPYAVLPEQRYALVPLHPHQPLQAA
jgi:DNA polymerase-4